MCTELVSVGGGVAWLALTDPVWKSPRKRIEMSLAAVAPKYGWSDLTHALVPNGRYRQDERAPVGQAATHFPQEVQLIAEPQGWFRSVIVRELTPRPARSQV